MESWFGTNYQCVGVRLSSTTAATVHAADGGAASALNAESFIGRVVARRFMRDYVVATFPLGVLITVYYALWVPLPADEARLGAIAGNLGLFAVYGGLFLLIFRRWLRHALTDALEWTVEDRSATASEADTLRRLPRRIATYVLVFQAGVAAVTALLNLSTNGIPFAAIRVVVGLALAALTFSALAYLVAEHSLRDVFALGFRVSGGLPTRANVGVQARLLLGWALGSAIPLLFILAIPIAREEHGRLPPAPTVPMMFMAVTGLVAGAATTFAVARSISQPLANVRAGFQRVRNGDLEGRVEVDDPGELGLLQSGFNDMVDGLRERRLLEDLFGRHVGEEVARRALREGVELGGEVRDASVLMIDVIGSTALARRLPPDEVVRLLNEFFGVVVESVHTRGGWVNKFEGDAALCVFGVPDRQPDHADRALQTAADLRRNLAPLFAAHPDLDAGIGVSGGPVVAGNIGAASRLEYTVIGDPVNEAARLADLAKTEAGRVAASGTVIALAASTTTWCHTASVVLRGRDALTEVFIPT